MNPADETAAKIEPTERQSAGATAGSGDILHKFEERLRALKDNLQHTASDRRPQKICMVLIINQTNNLKS